MQQIREDFPVGRYPLKIEYTQFSLKEYRKLLESRESSTRVFRKQRSEAFARELQLWHETGQFHFEAGEGDYVNFENDWSEDSVVVESSVAGSVWQTCVKAGATVDRGQTLVVIESMKMEIELDSPCSGVVKQLLSETGKRVNAGQPLVVIEEHS